MGTDSTMAGVIIVSIVYTPATARFAYSIMMVASLGFLGVGLQPPTPDWGMMVIENKQIIATAPWAVIFPALAIVSGVTPKKLAVNTPQIRAVAPKIISSCVPSGPIVCDSFL